jgi:hypothetical protein
VPLQGELQRTVRAQAREAEIGGDDHESPSGSGTACPDRRYGHRLPAPRLRPSGPPASPDVAFALARRRERSVPTRQSRVMAPSDGSAPPWWGHRVGASSRSGISAG